MREIEFRAWDQVKKKMVRCSIHQDGLAIQAGYNIMTAPTPARFMVPMQYTGLKDANGVKIFEGDIIQIGKTSRHILKVEFINAYVGGWVLTHEDSSKWLSLGAREDYELTVVGNIYENPKLLQASVGTE